MKNILIFLLTELEIFILRHKKKIFGSEHMTKKNRVGRDFFDMGPVGHARPLGVRFCFLTTLH